MGKIVEGYWDCPYCDQKEISGLEKHCPGCGHPQDAGTTFYLKKEKKYVEESKAEKYGKGADWTCAYCGSLNHFDQTVCANCGSDREETTGDYHQNQDEMARKEAQKKAEEAAKKRKEQAEAAAAARRKRLPILVAVLAVLVFLLMPKSAKAVIDGKSWGRQISIEHLETVQESDWSLPADAKLTDQKEEFHHFDTVVDHYETVEVQRSRQVQRGYDTYIEYVDNGDGTFSEEEVSTPHYETEYYTETAQQPVYVQLPVYQTKYYYDIDRWEFASSVLTEGTDDEPVWGEVVLSENEREGERKEYYSVDVSVKKKTYYATISEELWNSLKVGDKVEATVQNGKLTKINGERVY